MGVPTSMFQCSYFKEKRCQSCRLLENDGTYAKHVPELPSSLLEISTKINPWVRCDNPEGSRAKGRFSVSGTVSAPVIGILDKDLEGVELLHCPLHKSSINTLLSYIPRLITQYHIRPYSIKDRSGELKGLIVQTNQAEDHLRLRLVMKSSKDMEKCKSIAVALQDMISIPLSVSLNIQDIPHQIPEGPEEIHLYGETLLWETYETQQVAFPSQSFMQVTPHVAGKLYSHVADIVARHTPDSVLDLFCGAGGFALGVAPYTGTVYGVEISGSAVEAARVSSLRAGYTSTEFIEADLQQSLELWKEVRAEFLICNPPRRGLGEVVIDAIRQFLPDVIVYSSCNVSSFLNDMNHIIDLYHIEEVTPYEMFPLTGHYEILSVLKKRT
jgi:23S rRNA (uracil747-C5)-methyltransferase